MSYDTDQIATAIADALSTLASDGVGVQHLQFMPANPTATGVYVVDGPIEYDLAMARGLDKLEMIVVLMVGNGIDQATQRRLRKLRDGTSGVKALIEASIDGADKKTLGGIVDHARVTKASAPRLYGREGETKRPVGCEFTVEILATP